MPFGMKNAPSRCQMLMNHIVHAQQGCMIYIDDAVIYSDTWEGHLVTYGLSLNGLQPPKRTVNLPKSGYGSAHVTYLGHVVGQGQIRQRDTKVKCTLEYPVPNTMKELMRFMGMPIAESAVTTFADIVSPLTNLLGKKAKLVCSEHC